jgi:hypothetical protein
MEILMIESNEAQGDSMKSVLLAGLLAVFIAGESHARDAAKSDTEIIIGSDKQHAAAYEGTCVEVEIGGEPSPPLSCLNRKLRQDTEKAQPPVIAPPIDAKSQDVRVGVVNQSALRQQYGTNFGVSVFPQRPAPPVFISPLAHH